MYIMLWMKKNSHIISYLVISKCTRDKTGSCTHVHVLIRDSLLLLPGYVTVINCCDFIRIVSDFLSLYWVVYIFVLVFSQYIWLLLLTWTVTGILPKVVITYVALQNNIIILIVNSKGCEIDK